MEGVELVFRDKIFVKIIKTIFPSIARIIGEKGNSAEDFLRRSLTEIFLEEEEVGYTALKAIGRKAGHIYLDLTGKKMGFGEKEFDEKFILDMLLVGAIPFCTMNNSFGELIRFSEKENGGVAVVKIENCIWCLDYNGEIKVSDQPICAVPEGIFGGVFEKHISSEANISVKEIGCRANNQEACVFKIEWNYL